MYDGIEGKIVKSDKLFQECSKWPTIHYRGDSAVCTNMQNCTNTAKEKKGTENLLTDKQPKRHKDIKTASICKGKTTCQIVPACQIVIACQKCT